MYLILKIEKPERKPTCPQVRILLVMNQMPAPDFVRDVKVIKAAILKSRYVAARHANAEMLKLYFAIGAFVSRNSREGRWGTGAIEEISRLLQKELPGLRGFSVQNMRNMRQFFEEWGASVIRQTVSGEIKNGSSCAHKEPLIAPDLPVLEIRQPLADELSATDANAFMSVDTTRRLASPRTVRRKMCRTSTNPSARFLTAHGKSSTKSPRIP